MGAERADFLVWSLCFLEGGLDMGSVVGLLLGVVLVVVVVAGVGPAVGVGSPVVAFRLVAGVEVIVRLVVASATAGFLRHPRGGMVASESGDWMVWLSGGLVVEKYGVVRQQYRHPESEANRDSITCLLTYSPRVLGMCTLVAC